MKAIGILLSLFFSLFLITSVYAQNTTEISQPSPYVLFVEIQIRNQDGVLAGVVVSDHVRYRDDPSTDEFLDRFLTGAIVEGNGIKYEKIVIRDEITTKEDAFIGRTDLYSIPEEKEVGFSAQHHAFIVDKDYTYFIKWTIYRPI